MKARQRGHGQPLPLVDYPLFTVLLGTLALRERLRWGQWDAVALATAGLLYLVVALAELPWVALALAGSFSLYGLTRKLAAVDPLIGLSAETLAVLPERPSFWEAPCWPAPPPWVRGSAARSMGSCC
jgi:RarD protein